MDTARKLSLPTPTVHLLEGAGQVSLSRCHLTLSYLQSASPRSASTSFSSKQPDTQSDGSRENPETEVSGARSEEQAEGLCSVLQAESMNPPPQQEGAMMPVTTLKLVRPADSPCGTVFVYLIELLQFQHRAAVS